MTKLLQLSNGMIISPEEYELAKDLFEVEQITITGERETRSKKVTQYVMSGAEILETNDWPGEYIPIIPVYGEEVIVDGKRHLLSMVRFAKDPQQMFNFWRTASTELVALAPKTPFIGAVGQFATDTNKWQTANTTSHAFIEYDAVDVNGTLAPPPQRQPFAGPPAGALQEAMNAADDMKSIMGLYDASLGARSNETSGRAILARQREGDISTFNFTDNLARAVRHAGRILCDLIPKVYNVPRILRVIQDDGSNIMVPVNGAQGPQPTPEQLHAQEQMKGLAQVYDLTVGKYDVTCETGPSYNTRREEAANQMIEFIRANPSSAPLIGDLLAKNLDWPGADEIAARMRKALPPNLQDGGQDPQAAAMQQQMQQMQGVIQQLQQQLAQAQQDNAIDVQKNQIDARKVQIDEYNAETNRLKVTAPAMGPAEIQMLVIQTLQQVLTPAQTAPQAAPDLPIQ
jgi:hypothetical protein